MDKAKVQDEGLRRRMLSTLSDLESTLSNLESYKGPVAVNNTTTTKKRAEREAIASDVEAFLRSGGKITVLDPEETGYKEGSQAFVISAKNNSNAT